MRTKKESPEKSLAKFCQKPSLVIALSENKRIVYSCILIKSCNTCIMETFSTALGFLKYFVAGPFP